MACEREPGRVFAADRPEYGTPEGGRGRDEARWPPYDHLTFEFLVEL
jgi:hypothetical protein